MVQQLHPVRRSIEKEKKMRFGWSTAGTVGAVLAAGLLAPPTSDATLVPRTVFAEEFGYIT
jgi:hypothetical protein